MEKAPAGADTAKGGGGSSVGVPVGILWWHGAVGEKEREWTIVGGLSDEKERERGRGGAPLGIPVVVWSCWEKGMDRCGWIG